MSGLVLIALYGLGLASPAALVAIPTTLFLVVYLGCMTSAVRVLRGPARRAAAPAAAIVAVVLGYCGWALLAPALVAVAVAGPAGLASRPTGPTGPRRRGIGRGAEALQLHRRVASGNAAHEHAHHPGQRPVLAQGQGDPRAGPVRLHQMIADGRDPAGGSPR